MRRREAVRGIGAGALAGVAGCLGALSGADREAGHPPEDVLGVAHLDGRYHLTDEPFLQEGADVVDDLGSNVLKVWLDFPSWYYGYGSDWDEEYDSMVTVAKEPGYRALFEGPFSTYLLKATANHHWPRNYYRGGIEDWQLEEERDRFEAITRHLLETYGGSGDTFVLQDVEGDFWAAPDRDPSNELPRETVLAMQEWYRARQTGVERGRSDVESDATVLHAAEVAAVLDAQRSGASRVVNEVLPAVEVDLVSYSAWELGSQISGDSYLPGHNDREQFQISDRLVTETLEYVAGQIETTGYADRILSEQQRPVFLGEFGAPLQEVGSELGLKTIRSVLEPSLEWGVRWAVYWQVYCNELVSGDDPEPGDTVTRNDEVRGFYLVRPDGTKAPTWEYFRDVLGRDERY